ncbi:hypothetical protein, partial [Escherichia coli]
SHRALSEHKTLSISWSHYLLWHNDFMMACDMYFRWGHFNK